jgi:hypothetical protein
MAKKDKTERARQEIKRQTNPERAAHLGSKPGVNDACCTECTEWYDTNDDKQVNKHAH